MTYKRVQITKTVYVNTGGIPGSSSTSDAIALYARVSLADTITSVATDNVGFYARVTLPDTAGAQSDTAGLYAKVNLADTASAQADLLNRLGVTGYDANNAPDDALNRVNLSLPDDNASPVDAAKAGFSGSGLADVTATPSDARSAAVRVWGASQTNSSATNPANALGQADGIFATVQGNTGLGASTATLTVTIPVASIPVSTSGTYTLRMYATGSFGLLTTLNATYTNTGGTPASGTLSSGASVTAPTTDVTLTKIGTALTVTFTSTGALLAGSSWVVDAVCVIASPTF